MTFIAASAAGSSTDTVARFLAEQVSKSLKQPVMVEDIPGANGIIGNVEFLKRPADGYTVIIGTNSGQAANYSLYKTVPYQPQDFAPVACLLRSPSVLVVRAGLPVKNIQELIAYAKENPGKLTYGWGSSTTKVGAELFRSLTGANIRAISYKGTPQMITDMLGNRLDMFFDVPVTVLPHVQSGTMRALAVTSDSRVSAMPDVPTMQEAGVKEYVLAPWYGAFLKAGAPQEVINKLNAAFAAALKTPEYLDYEAKSGTQPFSCSPEELGKHVTAEIKKWRDLIELAGIEKQ
jgi:tripartite-type tricarboxylate transporter receptor subunit TctC